LISNRSTNPSELIEMDRQLRLLRRIAIARIAIRLHQIENGAPPAALADLVAAGYLPRIPADPYSDRPLLYRISTGETLPSQFVEDLPPMGEPNAKGSRSTPTLVEVEPGQPILWSVGPNRLDDGGTSLPQAPGAPIPAVPVRGTDLVFLVQPPRDRH
jgi:hypothetical protein